MTEEFIQHMPRRQRTAAVFGARLYRIFGGTYNIYEDSPAYDATIEDFDMDAVKA